MGFLRMLMGGEVWGERVTEKKGGSIYTNNDGFQLPRPFAQY